MNDEDVKKAVKLILNGAIGVMPTDTVFGLVARADSSDLVEKAFEIKGRDYSKPPIVLISRQEEIGRFGIELNRKQIESLNSVWPGPISVIFDCPHESLNYLHRGKHTLALRLPFPSWLRGLINQTGPIIATSANQSGYPTPKNIEEIKKQLPDLDFYFEGKTADNPSRLARMHSDGQIEFIERS